MALSISRLINKKSVAFAAPVALALVVSACSSDDNAGNPAGMDGGGTGGAQGSTGGAKSSGGAKGSGGSKSSGGASSGGQGGAGGSGTGGGGGAAGAGGAGAGGKGTGGTGTGGTDGGGTDGGAGADGGDTGTPCTAQLPLTRPTVGSGIAVPSSATVVQHFHAIGTQNYTCKATTLADAAVTYAWSSAAPEANIYNGCGHLEGTHFANTSPSGPAWQSTDGSKVVAVKGPTEAHTGTIPWVLLTAIDHSGTGIFSSVDYIQRVNTTGGVSPAAGDCNSGNVDHVVKVPYTADYYFFEAAPPDGGDGG